MRQFLMERASFIVKLIDEMVNKTSRKKQPDKKKRGASDKTDLDVTFTRKDNNEIGRGLALSELELKINTNEIIVQPEMDSFPGLDASITACNHCGKRLLAFGAAVLCDDVDSTIAERMKVEGVVI
mmetsp:Transcript_38474/g.80957  ORF Transcript_38474/g.80957 Transcript_38474/m.80957 type:complete len:126 (+) Transcript_38474:811-1188(+)